MDLFLRDTGIFVFFILGYGILELFWRYDTFGKNKKRKKNR